MLTPGPCPLPPDADPWPLSSDPPDTDHWPLSSSLPADADPLVTGAPGAPMDVHCHDANRDYVIVTWKPPNATKESPVIGYFIDR